jgi:hypothetical protein
MKTKTVVAVFAVAVVALDAAQAALRKNFSEFAATLCCGFSNFRQTYEPSGLE